MLNFRIYFNGPKIAEFNAVNEEAGKFIAAGILKGLTKYHATLGEFVDKNTVELTLVNDDESETMIE